MANSELMVIYHLVMTNIATENAKIKMDDEWGYLQDLRKSIIYIHFSNFFHLVMTNTAMENPLSMEVSSWENHLFLWAIYTMAMFKNQKVKITKVDIYIYMVDFHPKSWRYPHSSSIFCWDFPWNKAFSHFLVPP